MLPILLACAAPDERPVPVDTGTLPPAEEPALSLAVGEPPPDFALVDVNPSSGSAGQTLSVQGHSGAVSAWYFFQSACSYCSQQVFDLQRLQDELDAEVPEAGVQIVGVNRIGLEEYVADNMAGLSLPVLQDTLSVSAWDTWMSNNRDLFILDESGALVTIHLLSPPDEGGQGMVGSPENYAAVKALLLEAAQ